jgi:hypothetical protein
MSLPEVAFARSEELACTLDNEANGDSLKLSTRRAGYDTGAL